MPSRLRGVGSARSRIGHVSQRRWHLSKDLRMRETAMKIPSSGGKRQCKGPKVGEFLACSRKIKEAVHLEQTE